MSQQNDEVIETFTDEPEKKPEQEPAPVEEQEPEPVLEEKPKEETKPKEKKRMPKGLKISLLVLLWLALLGGVVGLAFLFRPKVEIGVAEESFKWSEAEKEKVELVDVDFYSLYDENAISIYHPYEYKYDNTANGNVNPNYNVKLAYVPQIAGLKNEEAQNKINNRIIEVAQSIDVPDNRSLNVRKGDNMFNVFSLLFYTSWSEGGNYYNTYVGLSFDLTTGNELSFDDIFVKGANIESIVYKRFYNTLSTSYSFSLLDVERGIQGKEAGTCTMWCDPNVSLEEYYSQKENLENKLANIEEIALNAAKQYLAGEKKFYLESAGPVLINNNGLSLAEYYSPDDVHFYAYLDKYRTSESIYEDDSIGLKNMYLSAVNGDNYNYSWIEENDEYYIDFLSQSSDEEEKEKELAVVHDYVREVLANGDRSKYYYILPFIYVAKKKGKELWSVNYESGVVYEMEKEYFDKTFRKLIFEGKTHRAGVTDYSNPAPKVDKDNTNVVSKNLSDYGFQRRAYMDESGFIYKTAESLFIDGVKARYGFMTDNSFYAIDEESADQTPSMDWRELLIEYFYRNVYMWDYGSQVWIDYTDEEKSNHQFKFEVGWDDSIAISLEDDGRGSSRSVSIPLSSIPDVYLKEQFRYL